MPLIDMGMLGAVRCFFAACVDLSAVFNGLVNNPLQPPSGVPPPCHGPIGTKAVSCDPFWVLP